MMLYPLMRVTFHPFSDGRRHSKPSFVFMRHLNRICFRKNEQKSVWFGNFSNLLHVVKNLILVHQGIVRSLFIYSNFQEEMFLKEMCTSESQ